MKNKQRTFLPRPAADRCALGMLYWLLAGIHLPSMTESFPFHPYTRSSRSQRFGGCSSTERHSYISRRTTSFEKPSLQALPLNSRQQRWAGRWMTMQLSASTDDYEGENSNHDDKTELTFDWSTTTTTKNSDSESDDNDFVEENTQAENVHIPKGGISVSDEIEAAQRDRFQTQLVPLPGVAPGVAQLVTTSVLKDSFEPVRYLVLLSPPTPPSTTQSQSNTTSQATSDPKNGKSLEKSVQPEKLFVMVDVPPYSPKLVAQIQAFIGSNNARLAAIFITSRDAIHYNEAPGAFAVRRSHVALWKQAFPELEIVAYRLDVPRDSRSAMTQILDGQGPFAAAGPTNNDDDKVKNGGVLSFEEMGRPLTVAEWDFQTAQQILRGEQPPPDDDDDDDNELDDKNGAGASATTTDLDGEIDHDEEYSSDAIRAREENKSVLAVFTPGHTFGSLSFVFPQLKLCCSGFCIPVEDNRAQDNEGLSDGAGPALDVRGYITTSRAGITRQMESAKKLVTTYSDRFHTVLPSRGDPLFLDEDDAQDRQAELLEIIDQYKRIGEIYDQLGITSRDDSDNDSDQ